jgi:hypothetical protein
MAAFKCITEKTPGRVEVEKVVLECIKMGSKQIRARTILPMRIIREQKFTINTGHSHVVEAIGKAHGSKVHFSVYNNDKDDAVEEKSFRTIWNDCR